MILIDTLRRRMAERLILQREWEQTKRTAQETMAFHKGKEAILNIARELAENGDKTVVVTEEIGRRNIVTVYYDMELYNHPPYSQWQSKSVRADAGRDRNDFDVAYGWGWRSGLYTVLPNGFSYNEAGQKEEEQIYQAIPIEKKLKLAMDAQHYKNTDYRFGGVGEECKRKHFKGYYFEAKVVFSSDPHVPVDKRAAS